VLDVLGLEGLLQEMVVLEIDHRDRDVVGCPSIEREPL
jgi:hypothetical protein